MHPLDVFTEKQQLRDTRSDQQATRSLVQESFKLAMLGADTGKLSPRDVRRLEQDLVKEQQSQGQGQRDKMAFASIAFCSPLMLLGMGATFAFMDDMQGNRINRIQSSLRNRVQLTRNLRDVAADAAHREQKNKLSTAIEPLPRVLPEKKSEPAEKSEKKKTMLSADISDARGDRNVSKPVKNPMKVTKLLKEKQALVDYMEQMRGKLSLRSVSNLMARIEQLDKALKKIPT